MGSGQQSRSTEADPALARDLARSIFRIGVLANFVGAVIVFVTLAFVRGPESDLQEERYGELVAVFVVLVMVTVPVGVVVIRRWSLTYLEPLARGLPIQGEARRALFMAPWRNGASSMAVWLLAAVIFSTHAVLRLGGGQVDGVLLGLQIAIGGLTTMAIVALLVERRLRPAFARALRHERLETVRLPVRYRLLLGWVLGAAMPLLIIGSSVLDPDTGELEFASLQRVILIFVVLGMVAGAIVMTWTARSVADPLEGVRRAMGRVREGRLDAAVSVDDATEVGLLQAGFNDMVAGLRERERLRDLFGRHVGQEVVLRALERGAELGGEVLDASALFVDLVGSTRLAAERSPAEVVEMLNAFFETVVTAAEAEDGWVNKFEGDAALCVFGAPAAEPDHAARALRSARRLCDGMRALRDRYPELDAGIGVSSGDVLAGNVGAEQRYEYTVIGDPVNEAARLTDEAKARPSRVLASHASVEAAGEAAGRWVPAGTFDLAGRPTPTAAYEPA